MLSINRFSLEGNTLMRLVIFGLALVVLSGCATWRDYNPVALNSAKHTLVSMTGLRLQAQTGDYFLTTWPFVEREIVIVQDEISMLGENCKTLFGIFPIKCYEFRVLVPSGAAVLEGQDKKGGKYFAIKPGVEYKYGGWRLKTVTGGVVVPSDQSAPLRAYWQPTENTRLRVSSPDDNVILQRGKKDRIYREFTGLGIAQTITYIGLAQEQIRFVYKEFDGSTIRPAFTQEFEFDYVPEKEYGYKNSRFIVHRATSTEIDYTVLSAFGR